MRSLRGRLGIALAATAFVSVAITAVVAAGLLRRSALDAAGKELQSVALALRNDPDLFDVQNFPRAIVRNLLRGSGDDIGAVTGPGRVIGTGVGGVVAGAVDRATVLSGTSASGTVRVAGTDYAWVSVPATTARGLRVAVVISRPVAVGRQRAGELVTRVLLAAVAAVLVSFVVSVYLADRMTRPVRDVSAAAHRIAAGDLTQQVPVESGDEIGELARTFNEMSLALGESQRREREFVASVSHELRTPITAIRGYAEALQDGALHGRGERDRAVAIIKAEAERLERMVQDVMDLARLGARQFSLEIRHVDISDTLREAVAAHEREAEDAGVELHADLPDSLPAQTDPDRLRQVVSNLVQNALRVTPAAGSVEVRASTRAGRAVIEVTDTGPGIAPEDLPHVFERTYLWRASKGSRPVGTGLGLAIVRELVGALDGRIDVESSPGAGSTFTISLPVSGGA